MRGISIAQRIRIRKQMLEAVSRMNACARLQDHNWNYANYGMAAALKEILEGNGDYIDAPAAQDADGLIRIPAVFINGREAYTDNHGIHREEDMDGTPSNNY